MDHRGSRPNTCLVRTPLGPRRGIHDYRSLTRALRKVFVTTTDAMVLESTVEGPERGLCGAGQAG